MTLHPPNAPTGVEEDDRLVTVLAIAPERVVRQLTAVVPGVVLRAENIFDAVGEMLLGRTPRESVTVVVSSDELRGAPEATLATLRMLAPEMRIVALVMDAGVGATSALERAADAVLVEPVSDAAWRAALELDDEPAREAEASAKPHATVEPVRDEAIAKPQATVEPARLAERERVVTADACAASEPIGDTDLIQEIMFGPDGIASQALGLVRQQTGWRDVQLLAGEHEGGATVAFAGEGFGTLTSPVADAGALRAWANWLARWLALDKSYREYRQLTFRDDLTGAWNRRFFDAFLSQCIRKASAIRRPITVMVFDLDHFKRYNDEFGHEAGDEILRETVRLLHSVIRKGDRVCRIGGDEFAVIFADLEGPREPGSQHPEAVEEIASRFQDQISQLKFPKLGTEARGPLSISAGLATYPWDGTNSVELLRKADELALQSKRKGKNVITFGPGAAEACKRRTGESSPQD